MPSNFVVILGHVTVQLFQQEKYATVLLSWSQYINTMAQTLIMWEKLH